ncbi:MAG: potassium channel protein [Desulfuromonas sp.]|nr:MAG: potassium channel protein [Desulfuromonas sp.]
MSPTRNLRLSFFFLIGLLFIGTAGYVMIEDWSLIDALYMTVITVSTVGFREVYRLSPPGQVFTIALIIFWVSFIAYSAGSIVQFMVEGQLRSILGRRKLEKKISKLRNHYIICGYGRIGTHICREFEAKPVPFVVVEKETAKIERLNLDETLFVNGDATLDETLIRAGIRHAKGLITAVTSDTENVYITLTARGLNPDLFILARASEEVSETKLKRAGASKVISPYVMGASRMAQAILRPSVVDFIEIATAGKNYELQLEELRIAADSALVGKNLITSGIRKDLGIIIVGVKKDDGQMHFNPAPTTQIDAGDVLITLGEPSAILNLEQIATSKAADG